jgi:hypothetical protein
LKEDSFISLRHVEHARSQSLLIVCFLNGVTLDGFELQTITCEDNFDIDLFSSSIQVTELVVAEREVFEFS